MCICNFLAHVIGFYLLLISLVMLTRKEQFKKIIADLLSNPPLLALTGTLGIIFGLLIVVSHNVWIASWPVLVTLFGWFMLLQGSARLFFPHHFQKFVKQIDSTIGYALFSWIWLLIGVYLIWMGFSN